MRTKNALADASADGPTGRPKRNLVLNSSLQTILCSMLIVALAGATVGCGLDSDALQDPSEKPKGASAVLFNVDGQMPQFESSQGMFSSQIASQHKLEKLIDKAASDIYVQEIVIHFGTLGFSFARAEELAGAIKRAAQRGKPIVCHFDEADNLTYWTAAQACPKILVSPAGGVDIIGLSLEAVFLRELLASMGITADMLHVGKYKDAAEPLTRDEMSPEAREAAMSLISQMHDVFKSGIMTGRNIAEPLIQNLIDNGPYGADEAVQLGLADEISTLASYLDSLKDKYVGGVIDDYGKAPAKPFSLTEFVKLFSGAKKEKSSSQGPRIALVPMVGPVVEGGGGDLLTGMEMIEDSALSSALSDLKRDNTVYAVVLRIDSPGGSALASDNLWNAVRALVAAKPVIVSMGDVAASGGYYIASAANEIFASKATITGSIGVVGGKIVLSEAATKLGIKTERIDTGKRASLLSPFSPFGEDGEKAVGRMMQRMYDIFVDRVTEGRGNLDRDKVLEAAEGRVWSGAQALELGLVDKLGGLNEAIERAREAAKLAPGTPVEIYPKPKTLMEMLGETLSNPDVAALKSLAARHRSVKSALELTGLLADSRVLAYTPIVFEIH